MCFPEKEKGRKDSDMRSSVSDKLPYPKKLLNMDEAISKTKFGLFNCTLILVSAITLYSVSVETCGVTYLISVSCDMNLTTSQKGVLAGAGFFGIVCSSHLWGYLADTKGRRRIILPTIFCASFLSIVCSFIQNYYIFVTLRVLNGFFLSGSAANVFAYLSEFHNNKQRSRAIISSTVIYNGMCVGIPLVAWAVINRNWEFQIPLIDLTYRPWRLFMIVCALPGLLSSIFLIFLPESPKYVLGQGNKMEAYKILQTMNRWNNGKKSKLEEFEILEEAESLEHKQRILDYKKSRFPILTSVWNQTIPLFKPPYLRSTILLCTIQFSIYSVFNGFFVFFVEIMNGMSSNLHSFIDDRMMMCDAIQKNTTANAYSERICIEKVDVSVIGNNIIFEASLTVCLALAGCLLDKIGKFPVIFFVLLTTGLAGIACNLVDIPILQISLYMWLLNSGIASNVLNTTIVDTYPTSMRAMAISISVMFGRLGVVIGANTVAFLIDDHCETTFYLAGSILIAMSILAFFIPSIHKRVKSSDENLAKYHARLNSRMSIISLG